MADTPSLQLFYSAARTDERVLHGLLDERGAVGMTRSYDTVGRLLNHGGPMKPMFDHPGVDDWKKDAACLGVDQQIFFLELHQGNSRPAKAICAVCPVTQTCLDYAVDTHAYFGIWGGMTEKERKKYATKRRREAS